jgi:hypothetical protein
MAFIGLGTLIGVIAVTSVVDANDSRSTGNRDATSKVTAASSTAASSTAASSAAASSAAASSAAASALPPDCQSQVISWRDNGGLSQLKAVMTNLGNVRQASTALGTDLSTGADASQDEGSLLIAAASLQSDAQTAQAALPPACVPGLRTDEDAALKDAAKSALDSQDAVSELASGNLNGATDDLKAANNGTSASRTKFQAATSDVLSLNIG